MSRLAWGAVPTLVVLFGGVPLLAAPNRWVQTGPGGGRVSLVRVDPVTPSNVYALVEDVPFGSADGGATWTERSTGLPVLPPGLGTEQLELDPGAPSTLVAIVLDRIFRSTDGGATWARRDLPEAPGGLAIGSRLATDPGSPGVFYLVPGHGGPILRSIDGGDTWPPVGSVPGSGPFPAVHGFVIDPQLAFTLYATVYDVGGVRFFRSTTAGFSWTPGGTLPSGTVKGDLVLARTSPPT